LVTGTNGRLRGASVLHDVRECLAHQKVRRRLDLGRETPLGSMQRDRKGHPARERLERGGEAVLCEDRRVHAPRELPELVDGHL
jgi:hypothetical protein